MGLWRKWEHFLLAQQNYYNNCAQVIQRTVNVPEKELLPSGFEVA